jgi:hypothetical protein
MVIMKSPVLSAIIVSLFAILLFISCKRELSCEGCAGNNKPPTSNAGVDQKITLPKDSVILDGGGSIDPDGTITFYKWAKVAGPVSANINKQDSSKTIIKNFGIGVYQFELTVTDNGGLSAKDTVQVIVDAPGNQPPLACAGADQTITLPTNSVMLDGSCSADPDNNITAYAWIKISGPPSTILNANTVQTQVINLVEGVYQLELKVTDAGGLISRDTIQIMVNAAVVPYTCGDTNRLLVNASLIEIGTLSLPRLHIAVGSVGDKILFAGGGHVWGSDVYSRVDIYNITTNSWSTAELSLPRRDIATVTSGNKIFFAGGDGGDGAWPLDKVDVYDNSTNTWSLMNLSRRDEGTAAAAVGDKVLFAGGFYYSRMVDIYDVTNNTWSNFTLPADMSYASAVTAGNKVYFSGGGCIAGIVYDNTTDSWSTYPLMQPGFYMAGVNVQNKIYWAGGVCDTVLFCSVEVQDLNSGNITQQTLSEPGAFWKNGGQNAVVRDNKIIFYRSSALQNTHPERFDIYDIPTGTWSIGVLPFRIDDASIISVNNIVYLAGGFVNGEFSNKVWKLEF